MTCEEIREKISCMLDNELNAEDSAIVTEHLAECPECMCMFEAFHEISVSMEELEEVPDGFTEAVMQRIKTTASPKKRRRGLLWLAGMAACFAIVLLAGTSFSSTHQYVGGGSHDQVEYVNIVRYPKPAQATPYTVTHRNTGAKTTATPAPTDVMDHKTNKDEAVPTVTPAAVEITPAVVSVEPTMQPTPTPKPVTIPIWPMTALSDLLLVVAEADYSLHTGTPDYEITLNKSGSLITLSVWLEDSRIYVKNVAAHTAWYSIGTPKQLIRLVNSIAPEVTPTPNVTTTPEVTTTPDVTPTPGVTTTPDVTPSPGVTTTPDVTPSPGVTTTPDVTPTPNVTTTPDVTPSPNVTTTPDGTPTPTPVAEDEAVPTETPVPSPTPIAEDESAESEDAADEPTPTEQDIAPVEEEELPTP